MPDNMSIKLPDTEKMKFMAWAKSLSKENTNRCQMIVRDTCEGIRRRAMQMAPVNYAFLKGSLHTAYTSDGMNGKVYTARSYAAYQEWGTGNKVVVPSFVRSMFGVDSMDWKGTGKRKINTKAHPYLFENARVGVEDMFKKFEAMGFEKK